MKRLHPLLLMLLSFFTMQAAAHRGPEAMNQHLFEHLLIAFALSIPIGYGFLRLLKRSGDTNR